MTDFYVIVGEDYGDGGEAFLITDRARANCSFLATLEPWSFLPDTPVEPFRVVLKYLDFDGTVLGLSSNTYSGLIDHDDGVLLLSAHVWVLAGKLKLGHLQNRLIDRLRVLYGGACHVRDARAGSYTREQRERHTYHANFFLALAFQHLETECGADSLAERFLICFIGRLAQDLNKLMHDMRESGISTRIQSRIMDEARALSNDPIKFDIRQFKTTASDHRDNNHNLPTVYPPVKRSAFPEPTLHTARSVRVNGTPHTPQEVVIRNPLTIDRLMRTLPPQDPAPTLRWADNSSRIPHSSADAGKPSATLIPKASLNHNINSNESVSNAGSTSSTKYAGSDETGMDDRTPPTSSTKYAGSDETGMDDRTPPFASVVARRNSQQQGRTSFPVLDASTQGQHGPSIPRSGNDQSLNHGESQQSRSQGRPTDSSQTKSTSENEKKTSSGNSNSEPSRASERSTEQSETKSTPENGERTSSDSSNNSKGSPEPSETKSTPESEKDSSNNDTSSEQSRSSKQSDKSRGPSSSSGRDSVQDGPGAFPASSDRSSE